MAEKKETKTVSTTATKKAAAPKRACARKTTVKTTPELSALSVGFKAGDVYQSLATAGQPLTVDEVAKAANITVEEVLLGTGWLLKEGKVTNTDGKLVLA